MQQKEIGMQISAARKKLKYTQRELAEKLGVSDKTISKWERGAGYPDISLLLPLCRELGIEVSQLLGDEETDTQKQGNEKNLKNLADYAVLKVKENRERIQRWIWIYAQCTSCVVHRHLPVVQLCSGGSDQLGMDCCCVCHIWVDDSYGFAYVTSLFDRKNNAGGNGDAVSLSVLPVAAASDFKFSSPDLDNRCGC